MKMFIHLFAALVYTGCVYASPLANQYIDSVLNTAFHNEIWALRLDPTSLEDFTTRFEDSVAIIGTVKGKVEYTEGNLTGLSQVRRHSECQGPFLSFGTKVINCSLAFEKLRITYEGRLKYGKMPKVSIRGKSKITDSLVFVEIAQAPPMQPFVKNFMYQQTGEQEIKHTGLGPFNKFMGILDEQFKMHVQSEVFSFISQKFQYALNRAVSTVPLPN